MSDPRPNPILVSYLFPDEYGGVICRLEVSPILKRHNSNADSFCCPKQMRIGEMSVARRGAVPQTPQQVVDHGQVLFLDDGVTRGTVAQTVEPKPVELRVSANGGPKRDDVVGGTTSGALREQECILASRIRQSIQDCPPYARCGQSTTGGSSSAVFAKRRRVPAWRCQNSV